ncbi:flagellum-specific peptidoglycan hydrolase FlgJ [Novosphingobium sp. SG707]|nr:flagellum-specific peptidoglycan hydrolase FlgJ [Novosphingobium sp. SG707]
MGKFVSGKNNYGGITAKVTETKFPHKPGTPLEPLTRCWTHEVVSGQRVSCLRRFKDYSSPEDYFEAHGKLLATGKLYAKVRSALPDPNAFADALTEVYAADPKYGATLKSIIKAYNLRSAGDV